MLPNHYICSACRETFEFPFRTAYYYLGSTLTDTVAEEDLLAIPVRPAWCKQCDGLCVAEDIVSLRAFEDIYGAVKSGRTIEYPVDTTCWDRVEATELVEPYLRWRMGRRHAARSLCCGRTHHQFLDVAIPLLKHAECEYGAIEGQYLIGSYCGPGPGIRSPANIRLYDTEGILIGLLTWRKPEESRWCVEPMSYAPITDDEMV